MINRTVKSKLILILFLLLGFSNEFLAQEIIVLDSCYDHKYIIDKATTKDAYCISEWQNSHLIQKANFRIYSIKSSEKKATRNISYDLDFFFNAFYSAYTHSDFYTNLKKTNGDRKNVAFIDSLYNFDILGNVKRIKVFDKNIIQEELNYNGKILVSHFKTIDNIEYDTTFNPNGYRAVKRNIKGKIFEITHFENGKANTLYLDPKNTFYIAPFINSQSNLFSSCEEYDGEDYSNIEIKPIGNGRYQVKNNAHYEGEFSQHRESIIEKRSLFDPKGKILFRTDKRFRCIESQYFDHQNNLNRIKRYNKNGEITSLFFKNFCYSNESFNNTFKRKDIELNIYSSKDRLSYKSTLFKGTFYKKNKNWMGSDTFYANNKTYISDFSFFDTHFEYTSYLNGDFLSKGLIYESFEDLNRLMDDEEDDDAIGNYFFEQLHYQFHYENMYYRNHDSLRIGKDSSLISEYKDGALHLIFSTLNERKTIFEQNNQELNLFKDQMMCAMGARDLYGKTVIPAKFDEIEKINLYQQFNGYLCSVNDVACILSNEGKTIIDYKRGLSKILWVVSENFRKKHQLLIPILFICNDRKNDSFHLVSLNDKVVMSGKGELSLLENHSLIIRNGKFNLLMNRDGYIYDDSSLTVNQIFSHIFVLSKVDKVISDTFFKVDKNSKRASFPKKTYTYKYKIIDYEKGPFDGLEFNEFLNINNQVKLFRRPGQNLIVYPGAQYYSDTADLRFQIQNNESWVLIKHFKSSGILMPYYQKVIPPIYDEVSVSNALIKGRRKHILDIYTLNGKLEVSIPIQIEDNEKKYLSQEKYESYMYVHNNRIIKLYKIKIGEHYGLYNEQGKELLSPDCDVINIENNDMMINEPLYHLLDIYDAELVIKSLKNNKAERFIYRKGQLIPIQSKQMWKLSSNQSSFLIRPNGEIYQTECNFEFNTFNSSIDLYSKNNHSLVAQLDFYGNEIYNSSDYLQVKAFNGVKYVQLKNGKCGTLNCKNEFEIQPMYSELYHDKKHQLLWYKYGFKDELWKLKFLNLNKDAKDSFDFPLEIGDFRYHFIYSKNRKFGVMGLNAEVLLEAKYEHFARGYENSYLFSLSDTYYSWSYGMSSPIEQSYKNLFYTQNRNYNNGVMISSNAYKGYEMFIVSKDFHAVDSSTDMFFGRKFHFKENSVSQYSKSPFILQEKNNLNYINSIIQLTSFTHWSGLYPSSSFPYPISTGIQYTHAIYNPAYNIKEHIKFSDYTKLDYTHLKDKNMWVFNNGINTISFKDYYSTYFLNIYIDSLLGYMVFDLKNIFKGSGVDSLTEHIRSKWMKMDDPLLPCMAKDKIFENFINKFTIDGELFMFRLSVDKFISIPISELKPYMSEFWKKRF